MPQPLQVYVVEDSQILQRLLISAITSAGADVAGCSGDAEEAIADIFALQPHVVVLDISLRSGSGFDILKALQEHTLVPGAIKLVLTNHAEYREVCSLLGADRFFDKSMETTEALALIRAMAAERRPSAQAARSSRAPPQV